MRCLVTRSHYPRKLPESAVRLAKGCYPQRTTNAMKHEPSTPFPRRLCVGYRLCMRCLCVLPGEAPVKWRQRTIVLRRMRLVEALLLVDV